MSAWSAQATDAAERCGIVLSSRHWQVLQTLRALYLAQQRHPAMRTLAQALRDTHTATTMLELMQLFGERPLRTMSEIAGLPPPPHCL